MNIKVYQDYVHNNALLFRALVHAFGRAHVEYVDADDILDDALSKDTTAFFMPGGADLYYCEKLNGAGNDMIRQYVENGGLYVGICAGAYYACSHITWAKGIEEHEIIGARELNFFQGEAVGPIYDFIEEEDFFKPHDAIVRLSDQSGTSCTAHYAGGPTFKFDEDAATGKTDILYHYTDLKSDSSAALSIAYKKGMVRLYSFHPEISLTALNKTNYILKPDAAYIKAILNKAEENKLQLDTPWTELIGYIKTRSNITQTKKA